jgi:cell division protein ZapA
MSTESIETAVTILGKTYYVKCPPAELEALQQASQYLEKKLKSISESNQVLGSERAAVITALNIAHELLLVRDRKTNTTQRIQQKVSQLQQKVDEALTRYEQIEFPTTEQI